jgi:hypothetical protein
MEVTKKNQTRSYYNVLSELFFLFAYSYLTVFHKIELIFFQICNAKNRFKIMKTNNLFRLFITSIFLTFSAWIAKMHFAFGGDYLFRIGTVGIVLSLLIQLVDVFKEHELKSKNLAKLFMLNFICLIIAYLGMMLKVSHIMNSQLEKDFVLDFLGVPAILISIIYNFAHVDKIMASPTKYKLIFYRQILLPWILFAFSFLLYGIYSLILSTT